MAVPRRRGANLPGLATAVGNIVALLTSTAALASAIPALRASRVDPAVTLRAE